MDLAIIIINYKTEELTNNCLASLREADLTGIDHEIIVVDNASGDGSIEAVAAAYPECRVIINEDNFGFAKANNIGIRATDADHVLLLNSDTVVEKQTIKYTFERMKADPVIGAMGCKILLPDGKLDAACKRSFPTPASGLCHTLKLDKLFPRNHFFGAYNLTYLDEDTVADVDCLCGAYMMVSRAAFEKAGLLDEDYFMYGEDIDWCYCIKNAGFRICYDPAVSITHYKRASGIGKRNPKIIEAFYDAMGIFFNKHYKGKYNPVLTGTVLAGTRVMKRIALFKNR